MYSNWGLHSATVHVKCATKWGERQRINELTERYSGFHEQNLSSTREVSQSELPQQQLAEVAPHVSVANEGSRDLGKNALPTVNMFWGISCLCNLYQRHKKDDILSVATFIQKSREMWSFYMSFSRFRICLTVLLCAMHTKTVWSGQQGKQNIDCWIVDLV